jgi:hypothetical protein
MYFYILKQILYGQTKVWKKWEKDRQGVYRIPNISITLIFESQWLIRYNNGTFSLTQTTDVHASLSNMTHQQGSEKKIRWQRGCKVFSLSELLTLPPGVNTRPLLSLWNMSHNHHTRRAVGGTQIWFNTCSAPSGMWLPLGTAHTLNSSRPRLKDLV